MAGLTGLKSATLYIDKNSGWRAPLGDQAYLPAKPLGGSLPMILIASGALSLAYGEEKGLFGPPHDLQIALLL